MHSEFGKMSLGNEKVNGMQVLNLITLNAGVKNNQEVISTMFHYWKIKSIVL
jgi:hypothetical protein